MNDLDQRLANAVYQMPGASCQTIADIVGITKDAAQKRIKRLGLRPRKSYDPQPLPVELEREGDRVILGDVHCNYVCWDVIAKSIEIAKRFNIRHCVLAGDLFNAGSMSRYPKLYDAPNLKSEVSAAEEVFDLLFTQFKEIEWYRGNHDYRVSVATSGEFDMADLVKLAAPKKHDRITTTIYDRMWLHTASGKWLLAHQDIYSIQKLKVATDLAAKYECHTICAHQHHLAIGTSANGKYVVVDGGCCCTMQPYNTLNTTKMPVWAPGFTIIHKGVAHLYAHNQPFGIK